jgi:hypothetical protein
VREDCSVEAAARALPHRLSSGRHDRLAEEGGGGAPRGALSRGLWTPERRLRVAVTALSSSRRAAAVSAGPCPRPDGWRGGGER